MDSGRLVHLYGLRETDVAFEIFDSEELKNNH